MNLAPIVLFVYNRPVHTQRVIESLLKNNLAKDSLLIIYSDGPKDAVSNENVLAVRDYLKNVSGFKEVKIIEHAENYGLAKSIIAGVTEVVNKYGRVIVLEDDLVVSPFFLDYMNGGLEKYQKEDKVMQISGYMCDINLNILDDAIILPFVTGWGWATWKRAWDHFSAKPIGYEMLKKDKRLRKKFNLNSNYNFFGLLTNQVSGVLDTWGVLWYLSVFMNNGLAIHPVKTMVLNYGFDGSGTNCELGGLSSHSVLFQNYTQNFKFPDAISVTRFENLIYKQLNKELSRSFLRRIIDKILTVIR